MAGQKKKTNFILKAGYWAFLGALALIAGFLVLTLIPSVGNFRVLVVRSGSMEPTIHTGSIVIVKPSPEYRENDIITFGVNTASSEITSITHRVVRIETQENGTILYHTKGDANEDEDQETVAFHNIWGKVNLSIPYIGYGVEAARQPVGFFFIIVLPALLVIIDECKKIVTEIIRLKRKKQNTV